MNTKKLHTVEILPEYLQTYPNQSFFRSTVDRVFSKGTTKAVNAFIGRKPSYYNKQTDFYKNEPSAERELYQLEPAITYGDNIVDYIDYVSQIASNGTDTTNPHRPLATEVYSWCPYINISKLDEYADYYWCPFGAPIIHIENYSFVSQIENEGEYVYQLRSVAGNIAAPLVKIENTIVSSKIDGDTIVVNCSKSDIGKSIFIFETPDIKTIITTAGTSFVYKELCYVYAYGDTSYYDTSGTTPVLIKNSARLPSSSMYGIEKLVHGMILEISDNTGMGLYEVCVIGTKIKLIPYKIPSGMKTTPDYYTIERNSNNRNKWSKNNLWVHKDAIVYSNADYPLLKAERPIIEYNGKLKLFNYGLYRRDDVQYAYEKTHGFGFVDSYAEGLSDVVYQKALTYNVTVEELNALGYNVIDNGRIVVMNSVTPYQNKIYKTKLYDTRDLPVNEYQINLRNICSFDYTPSSTAIPNDFGITPTATSAQSYYNVMPWDGGTFISVEDAYPDEPQQYDYVEISNNGYYKDGVEISYDGEQWGYAQQYAEGVEPLFDLYDEDGVSFASRTKYANSGFSGAPIFGYKQSSSSTLYDNILQKYVTKNSFGNFVFFDYLSVPFEYGDSKKNKFVAIVDDSGFNYANHWHKSSYSISEKKDDLFTIHSSIRANTMNYNISDITKNQWVEHFISLKNQSWNQSTDGIDYTAGTKLLQHRNSSGLAMALLSANVDFLEALKYNEREYAKFCQIFARKLKSIDETVGLPDKAMLTREYVIAIIKKMMATKNESHPYYDNTTSKLGTFIPNTPAYLGITRLYQPSENDKFVVRHDGSYYPLENSGDLLLANKMKYCVYLLETIIYDEAVKHGASVSKPGFDFSEIISSYVDKKEYSYEDYNYALTQFYVRWANTMSVDTRTNSLYDHSNPLSYNYRGSDNIFGVTLPGHWRGMYKYLFRTSTPHTTPWEILGYYAKPEWWDANYSWSIASKRTKLITAISTGLKSNPTSTTKEYINPIPYTNVIPVGISGELLDPIKAGIIKPSAIREGTFSGDWQLGDGSAAEFEFFVSPYGSFGICGAAYILKPSKLISGCWLCNDEVFINNQWTKRSTGSRQYDFEQTINGEIVDGSHVRKMGVQTLITDYYKSLGKNITTELGNVIRGFELKLSHKFGGFMFDDMTVWSETSGNIPQANIKTILHTSPPKAEYNYSGVIVVKKPTGYQIFGYNPLKQYFFANEVDDSSTAISISLDNTPVASEWKKNVDYRTRNQVRYGNKVYYCKTPHTSSMNKFQDDKKYWVLIKVLPASEATVHWFSHKHNEVIKYNYGHEFVDIQSVVDFLNGYQHYLESLGFEFTDLDNIKKEKKDFRYLLEDLLSFDDKSYDLEKGQYPSIHLSPGAGEITFNYKFGFVENLLQSRNGLYSIVNAKGTAINSSVLEFIRTDNKIVIKSSSTEGIFGLRIGLRETEHAIVFDNTTTFGSIIFNPVYDIRQDRLRISCTATENWTGSINVDGAIIVDGKAYPNFDSKVEDVRTLFTSSKSKNQKFSDLVKSTIGYKDRDYLDTLMMNHQNKFEFYQGMIQHKGTPSVNNRLLRSEQLVQNKDIVFAEEWAFNTARYGNVSSANDIDILLSKDDMVTSDVVVIANKVSNTLTPTELTALDTDKTAVVLYSNNSSLDSRILGGYTSENIFKLSNSMAKDSYISAGYIAPKDFNYSMVSDAYFNTMFNNDAYELQYGDTLHFSKMSPYIVDGDIIYDRMCTLMVSDSTVKISGISVGSSGIQLDTETSHAFVPGDVIYIDKTGLDTSPFFGVYTVIDVDDFAIVLNVSEDSVSECVYQLVKPTASLVSRTSIKLEPTSVNSEYVKSQVLYPKSVTISGVHFGYYLELIDVDNNRQTYPHLRMKTIPTNTLIYVECGYATNGYDMLPVTTPRWAVYKFDGSVFRKIAIQTFDIDYQSFVDVQIYKRTSTLDLINRTLDANKLVTDNIQIVDMASMTIPGVIDKDLDFIDYIDPAIYSEWNNDQVGKYWFNTIDASFYSPINRFTGIDGIKYNASLMSKIVPGSKVTVFKWIVSEKLPIDYDGDGQVYSISKYSEFTDNGVVYYGYWITGTSDAEYGKTFSTEMLEQYMTDISNSGIEVIHAISQNSFVLKNVKHYLSDDTFVRIKTDFNRDTQKFSEFTLLRANDPSSIPTDELWNSLVYSLSGYTNDRKKIPSIISSIDKYGCDYKSGQTWFSDINGARAHAMQLLNRIFARTNMVQDRASISSLYTTDIVNPMQWMKQDGFVFNYYPNSSLYDIGPFDNITSIPTTSESKRVLIVDTSDKPFWRVINSTYAKNTYTNSLASMWSRMVSDVSQITSADIGYNIAIQKTSEDLIKIIKPYKDTNGVIKTPTIFTQEVRTKDIVKTTDWYATGYDSTMKPVFVGTSNFAVDWEELGNPRFVETMIDGKWVWLIYETYKWTIVAMQDGTYKMTGWNDISRDLSFDIGCILGLVRDNILTNAELNEFFFGMISYVLSEQNSVHWFFKTSYMHISGYASSMSKSAVKTSDAIESLIEYINEVKPYHVKVRDYTSIYNTVCGLFTIKVANEKVTYNEYKALRSPYNKLPFDTFTWSENTRIDFYVKTSTNVINWVMYYDTTQSKYYCMDALGNVSYYTTVEIDAMTPVDYYDIPFTDVYLPDEFYTTYGVNLKSRLYILKLRGQTSYSVESKPSLDELIAKYNITFV